MKIHDLRHLSDQAAYDKTQSGEVKSCDIIILANGIGVMHGAWPVVVMGDAHDWHRFEDEPKVEVDGQMQVVTLECGTKIHWLKGSDFQFVAALLPGKSTTDIAMLIETGEEAATEAPTEAV